MRKLSWLGLAISLSLAACASPPPPKCDCDVWISELAEVAKQHHAALRDKAVLRQALKACEERK